MNTKTNLIFISILAFVLSCCVACILILKSSSEKVQMYRHDVEALLSENDTLRLRNGELTARTKELELTKKDFESLMQEDAKEIRVLRRRNEELSRLIKTEADSKVEIITVVKDSVVYKDRALDTLQVISWCDLPWCKVNATIDQKDVHMSICHHDELDVVVFLEWKKFLWWKIKPIGSNVDVVSHNPYTTSINVTSVTIK